MKPTLILFDVNGTLLDMSALDGHFKRIFGSARLRESWFQQLQILWMTTIATDSYVSFDKLAKGALQMIAAKESVNLEAVDPSELLSQMTSLPPFADVAVALRELTASRYRLAALTNGTLKSAKAQLRYAGIIDAFDEVLSIEDVKRYKPASEPYLHAAKTLGVKPKDSIMVAAHAWDIQGAAHAGFRTAFLSRPRQVLNPLAVKPDLVLQNLSELAQKLNR